MATVDTKTIRKLAGESPEPMTLGRGVVLLLCDAAEERDGLRAALEKVNAIRNSITGAQTMNFSEHVYPLVALLDAAGFPGLPYPEARANIGTLIERTAKAEARVATLEGALRGVDQYLDEVSDLLGDGAPEARAEIAAALAAPAKEATHTTYHPPASAPVDCPVCLRARAHSLAHADPDLCHAHLGTDFRCAATKGGADGR